MAFVTREDLDQLRQELQLQISNESAKTRVVLSRWKYTLIAFGFGLAAGLGVELFLIPDHVLSGVAEKIVPGIVERSANDIVPKSVSGRIDAVLPGEVERRLKAELDANVAIKIQESRDQAANSAKAAAEFESQARESAKSVSWLTALPGAGKPPEEVVFHVPLRIESKTGAASERITVGNGGIELGVGGSERILLTRRSEDAAGIVLYDHAGRETIVIETSPNKLASGRSARIGVVHTTTQEGPKLMTDQ